jgi:hypothetical protein
VVRADRRLAVNGLDRAQPGGEVIRYLARHGESRVAKTAIINAVPPLMVQTKANPGGLPKEVFDGALPGAVEDGDVTLEPMA